MAHDNIKHGKISKKKLKNKNKIKKRVGEIFSVFCLISNTLPQFEQYSLQPPSVLHHRNLYLRSQKGLCPSTQYSISLKGEGSEACISDTITFLLPFPLYQFSVT